MSKLGFLALMGAWVLMGPLGCGLNMKKHYDKYRANLLAENYEAANAYLDSVKEDFYGEKNRLLFYMDKAMVLHLADKHEQSNQFLEKAKEAAEDLWTESVGEHAAAWVTTDNSLSYQGEDFEKVFLHFVAAQNFLEKKDYSAARVEARQITNKLELYNSKYEGEAQNVYRDDAYARWLAGMLAETERTQTGLNDAWIDYRKAIEVYEKDYAERYQTPIPQQLIADALRVLDGLGEDFAPEREELQGRFPNVSYMPHAETRGKGQIVLLYSAGEAPYKVDEFWTAQAGQDIIRIAFPKYRTWSYRMGGVQMVVDGKTVRAELAQDVTAIAIQNLKDHMARIKAKAIARAVAKYLAGKGLEEGGKEVGGGGGAIMQLAGAAWNIGNAVAEEADKRSWVSLPAAMKVAKVFVEPGEHEVEVQYLSDRGSPIGQTKRIRVRVAADETAFVVDRTFK